MYCNDFNHLPLSEFEHFNYSLQVMIPSRMYLSLYAAYGDYPLISVTPTASSGLINLSLTIFLPVSVQFCFT